MRTFKMLLRTALVAGLPYAAIIWYFDLSERSIAWISYKGPFVLSFMSGYGDVFALVVMFAVGILIYDNYAKIKSHCSEAEWDVIIEILGCACVWTYLFVAMPLVFLSLAKGRLFMTVLLQGGVAVIILYVFFFSAITILSVVVPVALRWITGPKPENDQTI